MGYSLYSLEKNIKTGFPANYCVILYELYVLGTMYTYLYAIIFKILIGLKLIIFSANIYSNGLPAGRPEYIYGSLGLHN